MPFDPSNWESMTLGAVVQEITAHEHDPESQGLERYVGLDHLDPGDLRVRRWGLISEGVTFTKVFRAGQVLFGKRRVYLKKVGVPDFDGICSGDIIVLDSKDKRLSREFLALLVQTDAFFAHAEMTSSGSLSPRTKFRELARFEFQLPPLEQQRELVELMQGFETAIEASSESVQAALEFGITLGKHLLSNEAEETAQLDKVAEIIGGKQLSPAQTTGANMRHYLRAANIRPGWIDFSDVNEMNFEHREQERLILKPGDTLLMEGNANPNYVGTPALYDEAMPKDHCIQNTVIRVRSLDPKKLSPSYLYVVMQHQFQSGKFKELASGSSIKHLGSTRVAKIKVHIPSLERQETIVSKLLRATEVTRACQREHESLRRLRSSIFNTALTPSTTTEELLEVLA